MNGRVVVGPPLTFEQAEIAVKNNWDVLGKLGTDSKYLCKVLGGADRPAEISTRYKRPYCLPHYHPKYYPKVHVFYYFGEQPKHRHR